MMNNFYDFVSNIPLFVLTMGVFAFLFVVGFIIISVFIVIFILATILYAPLFVLDFLKSKYLSVFRRRTVTLGKNTVTC